MLEITEGSVMPAAAASGQKPNCVHAEQAILQPKDSSSDEGLDAQCALHAQYVLQLLQLQRRAEFLCDITIHVRDRSFKAHKPLLAACSLYFRRLFADAESKESTALNLTALTPNGFQVLLDYIYSGSLAITAENSSEVLSAATCLQMTNVVETCLSFMRSSFRMTKNNDLAIPSTTTQNSSSLLGASAIPDYSIGIGKHFSKYKPPADAFGRKKLSAKIATSCPASQDNLQILSTESINETEFKNMVVDVQDKSPLINKSGTSTQPVVYRHLPSASQLQSVLPMLMTSHPRQPTLTEVQRILTSVPNDADRNSTSASSDSQINLSALNLTTSTCYKSPKPHLFQSEHGRVVAATSLGDNLPSTSTFDVNCQSQNGPTSSMSTVLSNDNSAMDFSAISSAAHSSITPERNSGDAQTGSALSDHKKVERISLRRHEQMSSPERDSSDEQGNSVEISSEEESECDVWSADRSVISSSDLSGTPFPADTQTGTHPSLKSKFSALRLHINARHGKRHKLDANDCKVVSKALSLPSLPGKLPLTSDLTRTHSMGEGSAPVITYEKAASAMAALACSPSDSLETHSSNLSEDNKIGEAPKIVSQVVHKNLLPINSSVNGRASHAIQNLHQDELTPPADNDFKQTSDLIKVEHHSDVEENPRGFPVSKEFPKSRGGIPHALENDPDAVQPQYLLEEHANTGADDDDFALDLSMPQHSNRRRNSSIQFDEQSPQYPPSSQNYDSDAIEKWSSSRHPSTASSLSDPGMQLAVDALSMLRQSQQTGTKTGWSQGVAEQSHTPTKNNVHLPPIKDSVAQDSLRGSQSSDGASLKQSTAMFSRKPRRTTGGQTCTWPGCGRLFRHRNIYEEHQRLHELGIPVSQLRKCYMGARVKKTVREQLEELRTNDNVFEGSAEAVKHSRVRKRKSTSDNQEPVRKRVTVKDRPGAFGLFGQTSTSKPAPPPPPPRIRQSLSHPATGQQVAQFQHPSTSISNYLGPRFIHVMGADRVLRLAQTAEPPSTTTSHNPPTKATSLSQQALQQTVVGSMPPPHVSSVQVSVASSQAQSINPVEATLALLGIRTPVRRSSASAYPIALPLSTLSTDQMRRRLAVRESTGAGSIPAQDTSILVSAATSVTPVNPVIARGTAAHPGVFTLSEMYPASPRSSGTAPQPRSSHNRSPTPPS